MKGKKVARTSDASGKRMELPLKRGGKKNPFQKGEKKGEGLGGSRCKKADAVGKELWETLHKHEHKSRVLKGRLYPHLQLTDC